MRNLKRNAIIFTVGGIGYGAIELLWRRHTHPTMLAAGGVCFLLLSQIAEKMKDKPLVGKAALSALGITGVELGFGVVFNRLLKMNVWDYSNMPLNFLGQICPQYSALWCGLSLAVLPLADMLNCRLAEK